MAAFQTNAFIIWVQSTVFSWPHRSTNWSDRPMKTVYLAFFYRVNFPAACILQAVDYWFKFDIISFRQIGHFILAYASLVFIFANVLYVTQLYVNYQLLDISNYYGT